MKVLATFAKSQMNHTEAAYARAVLEPRRMAGEVQWWAYEAMKLRLADHTFYTADFVVVRADGGLEAHEVKATWSKGRHKGRAGWAEDSRVKIKVAATLYPWIEFVAANLERGGRWAVERFHAHDLPRMGAA